MKADSAKDAKAAAERAVEAAIQDVAAAGSAVTANNLKVADNASYLALSAEDQTAMDEALAAAQQGVIDK